MSGHQHAAIERHVATVPTAELVPLPVCSDHPGSFVRRYRSHGPDGPGVYPQCMPRGGEEPHLLSWQAVDALAHVDLPDLSQSERDVFEDAAAGLSVVETARKRFKGSETVKTQRRSILLKLGARNMAHAVALALCGSKLQEGR